MSNKKQLLDWIEKNKDSFFEVSDFLWDNPELSLQEYEAFEKVSLLLEDNGFTVEKGVSGMPTAFIASWGEGAPVFGFSSEYDALPGLSQKKESCTNDPIEELAPGHGCGHNLMAIGGVLAACALKSYMEENKIKGTLKVFGTPAEELCIGKPFMAKDGHFKDVDMFFDWHPNHLNRGTACDTNAYFNVKYHFRGRTAHGNAPWEGRSAMDGALLAGHAIEILREHIRPGSEDAASTINYAFPDVGTSFPNVVPAYAVLWCVGRMKNAEMAADVLPRLHKCATGAAEATETAVDVEVITATHEMLPNLRMAKVIDHNLREIGVPEYSEVDQKDAKAVQKAMGVPETGFSGNIEDVAYGSQPVTDASEYSWHAPLAFLNLSLTPSANVGWHNWVVTKFSGGELGKKIGELAAKVLASSALDVLSDDSILQEANEELKGFLAGRSYETLLPRDAEPDLSTNKAIMERYRIKK